MTAASPLYVYGTGVADPHISQTAVWDRRARVPSGEHRRVSYPMSDSMLAYVERKRMARRPAASAVTRTRGPSTAVSRSRAVVASSPVRLGQRVDTDRAGLIDAKVELPPAAPAAVTVFRGRPLTCSDDGQPRAVEHEMEARAGRDRPQTAPQILTAPGERRNSRGRRGRGASSRTARAGTLRPGAAGDGRGAAGSGRSRWRGPSSAAARPAGHSGRASRQRSPPRTTIPSHRHVRTRAWL